MKRFELVCLLFAFTACSTAVEPDPADASGDASQNRVAALGEGSCLTPDGADACGAQSPDGCWCDESCEDYGDCCDDHQDVCAADPDSCTADADCAAGQYCAVDESCGGTGSCTPQPEFCTEQYAPVCGCDGETYANDCFAAAAGVSIDRVGACAGTPCFDDGQCGADTYCRLDELACAGEGTCQVVPNVCTKEYMPVCGCDGTTYGNRCMAAAAGTSIASLGACPSASVCDSVLEALATETAAIRSCTEDADCGQVLAGTSCGCTRNWVARVDADLTEWDYLRATAANLQCELPGMVSTCDCPAAEGFRCDAGVCGWNYL